MKLSTSACTATLTALAITPTARAWSFGPAGYGVFVRPSIDCVPPSSQILRRRQELFNRAFTRTSPRYEILDNDEEVKITLDVPGVNAEDINVSIEDDGKVLSISGQREKESTSGSYTTKFSQEFLLDPSVDIDKFTADLKNGVLIVAAPKDLQRIEKSIRKIPVMDVDSSVIDEVKVEDIPEAQQDKEESPPAESDSSEDDSGEKAVEE
jgi:HSP20 family protein